MTQVSVVIPNYNGAKLLSKNLPKVIKACPHSEIIVVDDTSTDDSVKLLKTQFPQVVTIINKKNQRFGESCNIGVRQARGEIVILLNSDVVPSENFLKPLITHFKDPKVFSVGCKEIEEINGQKVFSGRTIAEFKRGLWVHWKPTDQESQETFWTFGGSMAIDRQKFLDLGGFDKLFYPAYWEDFDLCLRAKEKGYKTIFEKEAIVYHNHETTNKIVFGLRAIEKMSMRNQILLVFKHARGVKLFQHIIWLPYHLVFTNFKTKGLFGSAYLQAIQRYCSL
ncbi:glycosyltransferase family 2 protein [Candidatus Beckwithbacteria bacterium]|nr:glycosyltransferase family 2 protein [Candidatus Beckwithbacteria bacterium]